MSGGFSCGHPVKVRKLIGWCSTHGKGREDLTEPQQSDIDRLCSASLNRESQLVSYFNKEKLVATLDLLKYMKTKCGGVCPPGEYVHHYLFNSSNWDLVSAACLLALAACH
jgi:hypothetical protein